MKKNQNINSSFKKNGLVSFLVLMLSGQTNPTLWFQSIFPDIGFSQAFNYYVFMIQKDSYGLVQRMG
ncbi:MAG: hypothetical protein ACJAT4_001847 [Granulosicoccus sp.]|jgi:hypothetical protein